MHACYVCIACNAYLVCILHMHITHASYPCISCMHIIMHACYGCSVCMHDMHANCKRFSTPAALSFWMVWQWDSWSGNPPSEVSMIIVKRMRKGAGHEGRVRDSDWEGGPERTSGPSVLRQVSWYYACISCTSCMLCMTCMLGAILWRRSHQPLLQEVSANREGCCAEREQEGKWSGRDAGNSSRTRMFLGSPSVVCVCATCHDMR